MATPSVGSCLLVTLSGVMRSLSTCHPIEDRMNAEAPHC